MKEIVTNLQEEGVNKKRQKYKKMKGNMKNDINVKSNGKMRRLGKEKVGEVVRR